MNHEIIYGERTTRCVCGYAVTPLVNTVGAQQEAWCNHLKTPDVATLLGVSFRQLDHWIRRGWIPSPNPTPGSGTDRVWTRETVRIASVMVALVGLGIIPPRAAHYAATGERTHRRHGVELALVLTEAYPW